MSGLYPAYIRLENKKCVVVGGGPIAERKARSLLECGARVTAISPLFSAGLRHLADEGKIEAIWREYRKGDLADAFIVMAATGSEEVNAAVAAEAEGGGALVCVVDNPEEGNLLVPAVARQGDLAVSVSTGGRCPALAKKLRAHLEASLIPEYAALLAIVAQVRDEARKEGLRIDAALWQDLLCSDIIDLVRRGMVDHARDRVVSLVAATRGDLDGGHTQAEGGR